MAKRISLITSDGPIEGHELQNYLGTKYYSFQGIPYAKTPVGHLRFKDPLPVEPWKDVFKCRPPTACPQKDMIFGKVIGDEDCLQINVYTKQVESHPQHLPVMVWIHGGAFKRGSSSTDWYGPDYFMEKDVVLVTLNYRVGAFGFLSFSDPSVGIPGNAGLKDQVLALKWVSRNIHLFGGDINNITLFGESAGGCCVHMHMMSPMSAGLFHKAIVQSGCAFNGWAISEPMGLKLARVVGWDGNGGTSVALDYLLLASSLQIIEAQDIMHAQEKTKHLVVVGVGPVVEPYESSQCFMPASPSQLMKKTKLNWGWGTDLPLIIGMNSDEGLYTYRDVKGKGSDEILSSLGDCECMVPLELGIKLESTRKQLGKEIRKYYFGENGSGKSALDSYIMLMTDVMFAHGIHRAIRQHRGKMFVYRFAVDSTNNHYKIANCGNIAGTCHADDISYLFRTLFSRSYDARTLEQCTIDLMIQNWTNFAASGDPNSSTNVQWLESGLTKYFLNIGEVVSIGECLEKDRMQFWDNLYQMAGFPDIMYSS